MVPFHLTGFPRKTRVLVIVLALCFVWALLPTESFISPRRLLASFAGISTAADVEVDILRYVDPLIGAVNGGHVFPGATLPYGMAKPVADASTPGWELAAGFVFDESKITGFSNLHDSGTGGSPSLGNFPLFAHPGCPEDDYRNCAFAPTERAAGRVVGSTAARPGYFAIGLNNSVHVEMTATAHTALYRFNFARGDRVESASGVGVTLENSPLITVDLNDLGNTRTGGNIQVDPETGRMSGNGTFMPSFGRGSYKAHFCADFAGAAIRKTGTFAGATPNETVKAMGSDVKAVPISYGSTGAFVHFNRAPGDQVLARVGLSFISVDKACRNAENEIPGFAFEEVVKAAEDVWRDKLRVVHADHHGMHDDLLKTFWSGLYRAFLSPQDYTGENPLWESDEPYFDSFYCIWDSFRAQHPLLTIVDPKEQTRMVRALIDIYKNEGKLPDCRMSFSKGYSQGGSNADVVLADAFVKNLTEGIDWDLGYEAVVSDAEVEPPDWSVEGRGGLESWKTFGYIPEDEKPNTENGGGTGPRTRSISRTVEYAYDDFAIALMARGLGKQVDEKKYLQRSKNWEHLFNHDQEDDDLYTTEESGGQGSSYTRSGFKGFLQPRLMNGVFNHQPTRLCSPVYEPHKCYFDTQKATYEGSPWLYTFYVPQDMASLITALGGKEAFVSRLHYFHDSGIAYMGNEQTFLPTFQFHYGGRPGLSSYWVHRYIPEQFNSSVNGIPGNDDCAMGAFTAFAFMGFFPVAGQDVYLLTPPLFREVSLQTPTGKWATIRNTGFDPTYKAIYIQSARLNGKPYAKSWITHDFFVQGGLLEFTLGKRESDWGTEDRDLPPSMSTGYKQTGRF
ncbi:glycoside hydrolase family 92 protein [Pseudomassariella vexata]|uniref:Glycoside hydrolase family 92 protein n=1 Tax=Pseudomassariella vexata TaxID=1141098 RepID=A0A1Y2DTQ4_9PEZI|nr:glycoside hydrolase family 92 protein [Pseudomassariella vexata]ORY62663.1 glycoside hydrolase family 92 protein [Pseudomassariella vexata]